MNPRLLEETSPFEIVIHSRFELGVQWWNPGKSVRAVI
jgi:hypothetical protein